MSNPDKLLFPDDGITKGDLVDYHRRIADRMVPHLERYPLAFHRFPALLDSEALGIARDQRAGALECQGGCDGVGVPPPPV